MLVDPRLVVRRQTITINISRTSQPTTQQLQLKDRQPAGSGPTHLEVKAWRRRNSFLSALPPCSVRLRVLPAIHVI